MVKLTFEYNKLFCHRNAQNPLHVLLKFHATNAVKILTFAFIGRATKPRGR